MMALVVSGIAWILEMTKRFVEAKPRNQYEYAVFQAARSIIITAFLKPIKEHDGLAAE